MKAVLISAVFALAATCAAAQEKVLNLYSSRHYQTDEALYSNFTKQTGIRINRIEAGEDALLERLKNEGARSPADVLVTVDAGRLWRAEQMGLFQPIQSRVLTERIPAELRQPDGLWFAFSVRARPIFYAKGLVNPAELKNYEDLADPKYKGKICIRSSSNMYNLSLMSAMISNDGPAKAEQWAKGVVANLAREPKGGDTDQLKAVAAGECTIAVANSYYYVRLLKSTKPDEKIVAEKVGVIFPNQAGRGTHVNISGAGVMKNAPNKDNAVKFLEYLSSPEAQAYFANGNNEFPVNGGVQDNKELAMLPAFKRDTLNVSMLGRNQAAAQQTYDRAGWK
ncbi:Fe(3+) ABC transporter substrate-binding protein [Usitatibacter palustris]|uniref:Iron uptake protein A1 n=1 Tax=Usitatibacter palustris TaxID=2732487 RepID=A0A6M4H5Q5_9PROT|nr:Fe(3+) ABC transporter substrate-binding protein [Usitatibacter palustris]QJR14981.1 Iron uptake protein A1 [Usitatibacter palustris]